MKTSLIINSLIFVTCLLMGGVAHTMPLQFTYATSPSYTTSQDTWAPWGSYGVSASGNMVDSLSGATFRISNFGAASGGKACTPPLLPWCADYGAGGYYQNAWNVTLQLTGDAGTVADIYLDTHFWGDADAVAAGFGNSIGFADYELLIINRHTFDELVHLMDHAETYVEYAGVVFEDTFDRSVNDLYLGSLTVGDPLQDTIRILGFYRASANAYSAALGNFYARENSAFTFKISAQVAPPPSPVPEPATLSLLLSGLIGMLLARGICGGPTPRVLAPNLS